METYEIVFEVRTAKQWDDVDIDIEAIDDELLGRFTPYFAENCEWAIVHFYGNPENTGYMLAEHPEAAAQLEKHGVPFPSTWALHIVAKGPNPRDFVASLGARYPDMNGRIRYAGRLDHTEEFQAVVIKGEYHWAPVRPSDLPDFSLMATALRLNVFDPVDNIMGLKETLPVSPEVYASYVTWVCENDSVEVDGKTYKSACFIGEEPEYFNRIDVEDRTSLDDDDAWEKKWMDVSLILDPDMLMKTARVTPRYDQRLLTA